MLHVEQPFLGSGIIKETVIAIEMVGGDVGEHCDIAIEAVREVDLVTRQFEHIDPAFGQGLLRQDRQADIPAHQRRQPSGLHHMVQQGGGG